MRQPTLSICIPTFNRAHLLRKSLQKVTVEVAGLDGRVEVVISDNASTDDTRSLVQGFLKKAPIRYVCNERNIGVAANVCRVVEAATGDYCWIMGDDDLLAPGAVAEVLKLLTAHPDLPAIVTGYAYVDEAQRSDRVCDDSRAWSKTVFDDPEAAPQLMRWEDTCTKSHVPGLHTSIVGCVFARALWRGAGLHSGQLASVEPLSTLESTFPHTSVWVRVLAGKTILFAPRVFVCFFVGSQGWFERCWPTIVYSFALQLALAMRAHGAADGPVRHYENLLLSHPGLGALVNRPNDYAKAHFSLPWLIANFGDRDALIRSLTQGLRRTRRRAPLYLLRVIRAGLNAERDPPGTFSGRLSATLALTKDLVRCFLTRCERAFEPR